MVDFGGWDMPVEYPSSGGLMKVPEQMRFDAAGRLLVADFQSSGGGAILSIDPVSGAQTLVSSGNHFTLGHGPIGIAIESSGNLLVGVNTNPGGIPEVVRVNPVTGAQTLLTSGGLLTLPAGMSLDPAGDVLLADLHSGGGNGAIIHIDHLTGVQSTVTSGNLFRNPSDITFVPEPGAAGVLFVTLTMATRRRGR